MGAQSFTSQNPRAVTREILRTFALTRDDSASREAASAYLERDVVAKALSADVGASSAVMTEEAGLEPPFPPEALAMAVEHSSALRPCIDAYVANIDGTGHRFAPIIDLDSDDAERVVSDAMLVDSGAEPSTEAVQAKIKELRIAMKIELAKLTSFFEFICYDVSFVTLRRRTRVDLETCGNAFWEVRRDDDGNIGTAEHVPAATMRLTRLDDEEQIVTQRVMTSPISWSSRKIPRKFRRFVQRVGSKRCWFKELGDPRVLSQSSGKFYPTEDQLKRAEPDARAANEMIHFSVWSSRSPYGIPRWIGALVTVLGGRASEEVNFFYFDNKSVPPLAILVSGGHLTDETREKIQAHIDSDVKGRDTFHSILVIEADSPNTAMLGGNADNRTKIEMKPLTEAQHDDALFQNYEEQGADKIGMQFRLPRMLRGVDQGYNRATAEAAILFGEQQVFGPERDEFDFIINRRVLVAMEARFFEFRSNAPGNMAPEVLTEIIQKLTNASVLTPAEAREFCSHIFGTPLRNIDEVWTQQPIGLTVAGIARDGTGVPDHPIDGDSFATGAGGIQDDGSDTADDNADEETPTTKQAGRLRQQARADARYLLELRKSMRRAESVERVASLNEGRRRDRHG